MTLYEIDSKLFDLIDPETGELLDYEAFAELQMAREIKIDNTACYIKQLKADVVAISAEIATLAERKKAKENRARGLADYLQQTLNGERFESPRAAISYRKSTAVEIENENSLIDWAKGQHDELLIYKAPTCSKSAIKAALDEGQDVPGAAIVERQNMIIK